MKLRGLVVAALAAAAAAAAWLVWSGRPVPVTAASLARGSAAEVVYATGTVEPEHWAEVTPVRRGRIVESCRCEGLAVARGDMLFRLDDAETAARVREYEARLEGAQRELARTTDLFERGIATREKYDALVSQVAELRAALAAAQSQLVDLEIRAPMDGQVLRIEGEVGEVAELGEAVAWVGQPRPLLVIAEVNEEDIPRVAAGQDALIRADAFPGRDLPATVASITPMGDPDLKTYRVRLALPADTPVLTGMSVDVNIVIRVVADTLLAPASAVVDGQLQVVGADGRLELRPVETGIRGAGAVEILSGAEAGERVVVPARDDLAPGARVRAE